MRWEASGLGALVGSVDCARGTALSAGHRASQVRRMVPLLCAAAAGCLLCFVAASARGADRAKAAPAPLDNEDLLAEVVAQNAGVYLDPPAPAARKASKVSPCRRSPPPLRRRLLERALPQRRRKTTIATSWSSGNRPVNFASSCPARSRCWLPPWPTAKSSSAAASTARGTTVSTPPTGRRSGT